MNWGQEPEYNLILFEKKKDGKTHRHKWDFLVKLRKTWNWK